MFYERRLDEVGHRGGRANRVDAHALCPKLQREASREIGDCALGGVIEIQAVVPTKPGGRRHIDDRAALRNQEWQDRTRDVEDSIDIDREHIPPLPERHIEEVTDLAHACDVNENVDACETIQRCINEILDVRDGRDFVWPYLVALCFELGAELSELFWPSAAQN